MYTANSGASGEARSAVASGAREPVSASLSSASSLPRERSVVLDSSRLEKTERDYRYAVANKEYSHREWSSAAELHRSSPYRSSAAPFSTNASFPGPASKRKGLGRYGAGDEENGRFNGTSYMLSPLENGKAVRDSSVHSPGFSGGSPDRERLNKDLTDGHIFKEPSVSPADRRPASSPRLDATPRSYGNQSGLDGGSPLDRDRLKPSASYRWDTSFRGREKRDWAWSKPEYHRRTFSLPKLNSPRDWSFGDRELEGRIDRYGSGSNRDHGYSDVFSTSKDYSRQERSVWDRNLHNYSTRDPVVMASFPLPRELHSRSTTSELSGASPPPQLSAVRKSSPDSNHEETGMASPRRRPRLTWGQGLAKYEKQKTEEDPDMNRTTAGGVSCLHGSDFLTDESCGQEQFDISVARESSDACQNNSTTDPIKSCSKSEYAVPCLSGIGDPSCITNVETPSRDRVSPEGDCVSAIPGGRSEVPRHSCSILQDVQSSLSSFWNDSSGMSKRLLMQQVERLEQEIDAVEKEIAKLGVDQFDEALPMSMDEVQPVTVEDSSVPVIHMSSGETVGCEHASLTCACVEVGNVSGKEEEFAKILKEGSESTSQTEGDVGDSEKKEDVRDSEQKELCDKEHVGDLKHKEILDREHMRESEHKEIPGREHVRDSEHGEIPDSEQVTEIGHCEKNLGVDSPPRASELSSICKNEQETKSVETRQGAVASILQSNQKKAKLSLDSLSHLMMGITASDTCTRLYENPEEVSAWKVNSDNHHRIKKSLELKIVEQQSYLKFKERVLAAKYRLLRDAWKQEQVPNTSEKDLAMPIGFWDHGKPDECVRQNCRLTQNHESSLGVCSPMCTAGLTTPDEDVLIPRKPDIGLERGYLRMPSMFLDEKYRDAHRFVNSNALVVDPIAAEQERNTMNPWSDEERKVFLDKYSLYGKDFKKIASFLDHKTTADCVEFYYRNQKSEDFEKIHRKHQQRKRRDCLRAGASYLATTTTSVNNRHREVNGSRIAGLSLVAAAAAVMSVPRDSREFCRVVRNTSAATTLCPSNNAHMKSFQERLLNKQASDLAGHGGKGYVGEEHQGEDRGRYVKKNNVVRDSPWTDKEKDLFLTAVAMFGKDFQSISSHVGSKSQGQCKVYFSKSRKRLGLDRLVECHKTALEQDNVIATDVRTGGSTEVLKAENLVRKVINQDESLATGPGQTVEATPEHEGSPSTTMTKVECKNALSENCEPHSVIFQTAEAAETHNVDVTYEITSVGKCPTSDPVKEVLPVDSLTRASDVSLGGTVNAHPDEETLVCAGETLQLGTQSEHPMEPSSVSSDSHMACDAKPPVVPEGSSPVFASVVTQAPIGKEKSVKMETKTRREPTSWTAEEKEKFIDIIRTHGKNWDLLCESLPAKSLTQIKTYFQNSKAKLGLLVPEGTANTSGRTGLSRKRKADDSDTSSNAGSGIQATTQPKMPLLLDEGALKVLSLSQLGILGNNVLGADALAQSNLLGIYSPQVVEDALTAQRAFSNMGQLQGSSTTDMLSVFNSSLLGSANVQPFPQSSIHPTALKTQQVVTHQETQLNSTPIAASQSVQPQVPTLSMLQSHPLLQQQSIPGGHLDLSMPVPQHLHKQMAQQHHPNSLTFLQQQQQQHHQMVQQLQQQVTEAVLQQLQPQLIKQHQQHQQLQSQISPAQALSHLPTQSFHQSSLSQQTQASSQLTGLQQVAISQAKCSGQQQQSGLAQLFQMQHTPHTVTQQYHTSDQQQQFHHLQQLIHHQFQFQRQQQIPGQQLHSQVFGTSKQTSKFSEQPQQLQQQQWFGAPTQAAGSVPEVLKQCDVNFQSATSQQVSCDDGAQQQPVLEASQGLSKSQALYEMQLRAGEVKLFGQSLLPHAAPCTQQASCTVTGTSSPQSACSATSTAAANVSTDLPKAHLPNIESSNQKHAWQQSKWSPSVGNSTSVGTSDSAPQGNTVTSSLASVSDLQKAANVSDCLPQQARDSKNGCISDPPVISYSSQAQDGKIPSNIISSMKSVDAPVQCLPSREASNSDNDTRSVSHGALPNDLSLLSRGQMAASQGLPRVLEALVALAEFRLQNSSNASSSRTIDEFLSQSWEALCRDPVALLEAGKASGSFVQRYSGGAEILQPLNSSLPFSRPHLATHVSNMGVGAWQSGSPNQSSDSHRILPQSVPSLHSHNGLQNPSRSDEHGLGMGESQVPDGKDSTTGNIYEMD